VRETSRWSSSILAGVPVPAIAPSLRISLLSPLSNTLNIITSPGLGSTHFDFLSCCKIVLFLYFSSRHEAYLRLVNTHPRRRGTVLLLCKSHLHLHYHSASGTTQQQPSTRFGLQNHLFTTTATAPFPQHATRSPTYTPCLPRTVSLASDAHSQETEAALMRHCPAYSAQLHALTKYISFGPIMGRVPRAAPRGSYVETRPRIHCVTWSAEGPKVQQGCQRGGKTEGRQNFISILIVQRIRHQGPQRWQMATASSSLW
jgi:hypothetical protein